MKKTNNKGVGRPKADIQIPRGKFTFNSLMEFNAAGGWKPLTFRLFLKRDAARTTDGETRTQQDICVHDRRTAGVAVDQSTTSSGRASPGNIQNIGNGLTTQVQRCSIVNDCVA